MSVAVGRTLEGLQRQWCHEAQGGAQASTTLIPTILDLLQQAGLRLDALDAICFGAGPGSFTGLRTACSVAQGLAFGANLPVVPMDSLQVVAEEARHAACGPTAPSAVTSLLDARMNELYAATYVYDPSGWTELLGSRLVRPHDLAAHLGTVQEALGLPGVAPAGASWVLAGNVFAEYADSLAEAIAAVEGLRTVAAMPTARSMLRLAPAMIAEGAAVDAALALPHYVRDKVAQTTAERMAAKTLAARGR